MKKSRKNQQDEPAQAYDSVLKELIQQQAPAILPVLLPGAVYQETLNVEQIRPTMRADRVYKIMYQGQVHILDVELQSGPDPQMASRLLVYHAILYHEYQIPVISIVMYAFNSQMAKSPLRIMSGDDPLITFYFLVLALFLMDAEHFVRERIICMYPLLPTMHGANAELIGRAMEELVELYRDDEVTLAQQFVWMNLLLRRTETVSPDEKQAMDRRLGMFDQLWDDHPRVKRIQAEARAEAEKARAEAEKVRAEARAEAEKVRAEAAEAIRHAVITVVKARFPALVELAQKKVAQIDTPDALDLLLQKVSAAPDKNAAHKILKKYDD